MQSSDVLQFFFFFFFFFLVETDFLGNLVGQDFTFSDQEHDMERRILTVKDGPNLKIQGSSEPLVLSRPLVQLPAVNTKPQGGWPLGEDSNKEDVNSRCPGSGSQQSGMKLSFSIFYKRDFCACLVICLTTSGRGISGTHPTAV